MKRADSLTLKPGDLVRVKDNRFELAGLIVEITSVGICNKWGYNPEYVMVKQPNIESDWTMLISTRTLDFIERVDQNDKM